VPLIGFGLIASDSLPWNRPVEGGATPTPSPSEVEPTDIPAAALLQSSDVPITYHYAGEFILGDAGFIASAAYCQPEPLPNSLVPATPTAVGGAYYAAEASTPEEPRFLAEVVGRYMTADAASYMDKIRAAVDYCGAAWIVAAESFAGEESLVVEYANGPSVTSFIFVRTGNLIAEIWQHPADSAQAIQIGRNAADRLCAGTTVC
jgi:hypothetical protein